MSKSRSNGSVTEETQQREQTENKFRYMHICVWTSFYRKDVRWLQKKIAFIAHNLL